jgi:hypothetical protein
MTRTYLILAAAKYSVDPIKKSRMSGACDTYVEEEKYLQGFYGETGKKLKTW